MLLTWWPVGVVWKEGKSGVAISSDDGESALCRPSTAFMPFGSNATGPRCPSLTSYAPAVSANPRLDADLGSIPSYTKHRPHATLAPWADHHPPSPCLAFRHPVRSTHAHHTEATLHALCTTTMTIVSTRPVLSFFLFVFDAGTHRILPPLPAGT